jgi:hypothetical protein
MLEGGMSVRWRDPTPACSPKDAISAAWDVDGDDDLATLEGALPAATPSAGAVREQQRDTRQHD